MSPGQTPIVTVSQEFESSPQQVFDAWTHPAMIARFLFGRRLREDEVVRLELNAVEGGSFLFVLQRQLNGKTQELSHRGRYLQVKPPFDLQFTWQVTLSGTSAPAPDSEISITIRPLPTYGGCVLTLVHELHPDSAGSVPRIHETWMRMLSVLQNLLDGPSDSTKTI